MIDINAVHEPIIVAAVFGVAIWVVWIFRNKNRWGYAVLPLFYLGNVLLFFTAAHYNILSRYIFNIWSDAVQLQGVIMIAIVGAEFVISEGNKWIRRH